MSERGIVFMIRAIQIFWITIILGVLLSAVAIGAYIGYSMRPQPKTAASPNAAKISFLDNLKGLSRINWVYSILMHTVP